MWLYLELKDFPTTPQLRLRNCKTLECQLCLCIEFSYLWSDHVCGSAWAERHTPSLAGKISLQLYGGIPHCCMVGALLQHYPFFINSNAVFSVGNRSHTHQTLLLQIQHKNINPEVVIIYSQSLLGQIVSRIMSTLIFACAMWIKTPACNRMMVGGCFRYERNVYALISTASATIIYHLKRSEEIITKRVRASAMSSW